MYRYSHRHAIRYRQRQPLKLEEMLLKIAGHHIIFVRSIRIMIALRSNEAVPFRAKHH